MTSQNQRPVLALLIPLRRPPLAALPMKARKKRIEVFLKLLGNER